MQSNASQSSLRGPPEIFVTAEDGSCKTERPVENSADPATVSLNDVRPAIMVTASTSGIDTPASASLNDIVGDPANLAGDSRNSKVVSTSGTSLDSTEDAKSGRFVSPVGVKLAKLKDGTGSGSGSGDQFARDSGKSRSTFHGSHLSLSQGEQERLLWGTGITSKHLLFASVAAASAALIASLPMAPLYEEGRKYEAFGLFVAACWFIGPALGVTCTVWMRKMNDLPTRWISLEAWLPGVIYTITACSVYVVLMALGLWPLPMLPIIGACTFAGPVFITIYLQLPEAIKSQPGYLMTYAKMVLVAAAMNAYWFILLIFYFLFSYIRNSPIGDGLSSALQILLTVAFKLISVACCHLRSHLAHHAMKGQKTSAIFRISILSEFEIDAACELYQALVLPDVQGVEVFIALLIIEGFSLAYVLTRDPRVSLIDSALPFIRKISIATVPPIDQSLTPTLKASVASKQEKEKDRRARILILQSQIFFMECVAKLFGSLTFVVMTPIMYYGPNKNWMSFSYDEHALAMGIAYTGISVAVLFVHLLLGFIYVKHKANTNLITRGLELLDDHMFQLMVCMYVFIPVLLTTHIGKQWDTITFLDQVFKRQ